MRFQSLSFYNTGVFRGWQELPFEGIDNSGAPLTLVRGENGTGKSTLFMLFQLAVYGPQTFGERTANAEYQRKLAQVFHQLPGNEPNKLDPEHAGVSVQIEVIRSGQPEDVVISRDWIKRGDRVTERLTVTNNGKALDVPSGYEQEWIHELIPLGHQQLLFFDGEKLAALSSPQRYQQMLRAILEKLLNLDHIDRLVADLKRNVSRRTNDSGEVEERRSRVMELQAEADASKHALLKLQNQLVELEHQQTVAKQRIVEVERQIAQEGGGYASYRDEWQAEEQELDRRREEVRDQLHELASGLLPFAFAPTLMENLRSRLREEYSLRQRKAAAGVLDEILGELREELEGNKDSTDSGESQAVIQQIEDRARAKLHQGVPDSGLVHDLADQDFEQVVGWTNEARSIAGPHAEELSSELGEIESRLATVRDNLRRVPDEEVLAPLVSSLEEEQVKLRALENEIEEVRQKFELIEQQNESVARQREQAAAELEQAQSAQRGTSLAHRSQLALKAFRDSRLRIRLSELEVHLVENFNALCRKEHLLETVRIDPTDFTLTLHGQSQWKDVRLEGLSAGERQLFALAMLKALREVSNRELPLVMDTPLARLDEAHRGNVLTEYLPSLADQAILLATDSEIDDEGLKMVRPYCHQAFLLNHDPDARATTIGKLDDTDPGAKVVPLQRVGDD